MTTTFPTTREEYGSYNWLIQRLSIQKFQNGNISSLNHTEAELLHTYVESGIGQVYFPPPTMKVEQKGRDNKVETVSAPYRWSFLTVVKTAALKNGKKTYDLPKDFAAIGKYITFITGKNTTTIPIVPDDQLRQLAATASKTGAPAYASVRAKGNSGQSRQIWQITYYPTPGASYNVEFEYTTAPPPIDMDHPWPLGGRQHAETILQSCVAQMAAADGESPDGPAYEKFMLRLKASIEIDRQAKASSADGVWPIGSDPDTLDVDRAFLDRIIGLEAGYGPHSGSWTHWQTQQVNRARQAGLRGFYSPPVLPGEAYAYDFAFLSPTNTIKLKDGVSTYDLPDDFAMFDEGLVMTYEPGESVLYPEVRNLSEPQLRKRVQQNNATGRPEFFAYRPRQLDAEEPTKYECLFWPLPDQEYTLTYRYKRNAGILDESTSYPFGGQPHANTVIASCKWEASRIEGAGNPKYEEQFMTCLRASISHDRKVSSPKTLGYNTDRSDQPRDRYGPSHGHDSNLTTYNGRLYD